MGVFSAVWRGNIVQRNDRHRERKSVNGTQDGLSRLTEIKRYVRISFLKHSSMLTYRHIVVPWLSWLDGTEAAYLRIRFRWSRLSLFRCDQLKLGRYSAAHSHGMRSEDALDAVGSTKFNDRVDFLTHEHSVGIAPCKQSADWHLGRRS